MLNWEREVSDGSAEDAPLIHRHGISLDRNQIAYGIGVTMDDFEEPVQP